MAQTASPYLQYVILCRPPEWGKPPVGGIPEKLYGARRAGVRRVVLPKENGPDMPAGLSGLDVVPAATVGELMSALT